MKGQRFINWRNLFYLCYLLLLLLWLRSFFARDEVYLRLFGHLLTVNSFNNHLHLHWMAGHGYSGPLARLRLGQEQIPPNAQYLELRIGRDPLGPWLAVPYWLPAVLMSAYPIWRGWSGMVSRRRMRQGRCLHCGYDLRKSGAVCPECGAARKMS